VRKRRGEKKTKGGGGGAGVRSTADTVGRGTLFFYCYLNPYTILKVPLHRGKEEKGRKREKQNLLTAAASSRIVS